MMAFLPGRQVWEKMNMDPQEDINRRLLSWAKYKKCFTQASREVDSSFKTITTAAVKKKKIIACSWVQTG